MGNAQKILSIDEFREKLEKKPILIDARKIADGGIGVYTQNVIGDLRQRQIPVALLGQEKVLGRFAWAKDVAIIEENAPRYSREELFSIARRINFASYSLYHAPHYMLPFKIPIPTVVTVHDLIHLTHPQKFYYRPVAWPLIASALIRSSAVVTVSASAQRDIARFFPLIARGSKISVIPNRLADGFRQEIVVPDEGEEFLFLSVSQLKPHKGIFDLLRAFVNAKQELEALVATGSAPRQALSTELVIAGYGAEGLATHPDFRRFVGERSDIRILGQVSVDTLREQYARAKAVVVPSRAEGFGFPVIEAHASGTPCILRPVPALLELCHPGDIVASDFSISALTDALIQALKRKPVEKEALRAALREKALGYSSESFIDPLLSLYRKLIIS